MDNLIHILNNSTNFSYFVMDQFNDPLLIFSTKVILLLMFNVLLLYNWSYLGSYLIKKTINYNGTESIMSMFLYTLWFFTTLKYFSIISNFDLTSL
jgi:hypothetical protein